MAKVIPRIHQYKLSEDLVFALTYADIEACFSSRSKQDVYLDVVLQDKQLSDKKIRDRLEAQGIYQLIKLKYDPSNRLVTAWEWANGPWKDAKNPIIIEVWVYGCPRKLCASVGLARPVLQKILLGELQKLLPKRARWTKQKKLTLRLLAKESAVECTSTAWEEPGGQPVETTKIVHLGQVKSNVSPRKLKAIKSR